jgi:hypothetical protein
MRPKWEGEGVRCDLTHRGRGPTPGRAHLLCEHPGARFRPGFLL